MDEKEIEEQPRKKLESVDDSWDIDDESPRQTLKTEEVASDSKQSGSTGETDSVNPADSNDDANDFLFDEELGNIDEFENFDDFEQFSQEESSEEIEPFGEELLMDMDDEEDEKPRQSTKGSSDKEKIKPLLRPEDISSLLSIPPDVRSSRGFKEALSEELKLEPQKEYRSHESFKDFLEFPTIAKNVKKMPSSGYFPKEAVKESKEKVTIADKIDIKSQKGNKVSVIVHRDHNEDIKAIEILTKDGDRVLLAFDTALTDREKVTEYFPDADSDPKPFTDEEMAEINKAPEVDKETFKKFSKSFQEEDYTALSSKLKDKDAISEDF